MIIYYMSGSLFKFILVIFVVILRIFIDEVYFIIWIDFDFKFV